MHNLSLVDEFGSGTVVVVEPEGLGLEMGLDLKKSSCKRDLTLLPILL